MILSISTAFLLGSLPHFSESFSVSLFKTPLKQSYRNDAAWRSRRGNYLLLNALPNEEEKTVNELQSAETTGSLPITPEEKLDMNLDEKNLNEAITVLKTNPDTNLTQDRFLKIFDTIEYCTAEAEENNTPNMDEVPYPLTSKARMAMTSMYNTLKQNEVLRIFGAVNDETYPAGGSKLVTPTTLETITEMNMVSLTPQNSNTPLLISGASLAILEVLASVYTGIDFNVLVFLTLSSAILDKVLINGAIFDTALKILWPEYGKKIIKHEAGHFLLAYLLGCPVEGCVLSSLAALEDKRFSGAVSAGTSFFDPDLSEQVNNIKPLTRSSIDRFTVIVMGGIAAEAIEFGRADGGASDEMSLVRFLSQINPRAGGAKAWNGELIRNQARWGAAQGVLLLRHYKPCYDALVDTLERGGKLGQCVYAIENAAREHGLEPLAHPIRYVRDQGMFGEWEPYLADQGVTEEANEKLIQSLSTGEKKEKQPDIDDISTSEIFLKEYRKAMEEKLRDIDSKLESLDLNDH